MPGPDPNDVFARHQAKYAEMLSGQTDPTHISILNYLMGLSPEQWQVMRDYTAPEPQIGQTPNEQFPGPYPPWAYAADLVPAGAPGGIGGTGTPNLGLGDQWGQTFTGRGAPGSGPGTASPTANLGGKLSPTLSPGVAETSGLGNVPRSRALGPGNPRQDMLGALNGVKRGR